MTRTPTAATASDVEDADCCSKFLEDAILSSSSPEAASKKRQKLNGHSKRPRAKGLTERTSGRKWEPKKLDQEGGLERVHKL